MTASVYDVGICLPSIREVGTKLPDAEDSYLYIYTRQLLGTIDGVGWGVPQQPWLRAVSYRSQLPSTPPQFQAH